VEGEVVWAGTLECDVWGLEVRCEAVDGGTGTVGLSSNISFYVYAPMFVMVEKGAYINNINHQRLDIRS
jgi:hypothetical protein